MLARSSLSFEDDRYWRSDGPRDYDQSVNRDRNREHDLYQCCFVLPRADAVVLPTSKPSRLGGL
ncbi:hypothetical protein Tcan_12769 [Toxocara canis]|uniref:Uncharacterized protein n=1 Tax=Toxocara canis TaxID=6265 RepID=A0A0B2VLI8_TOXCA|nr:hypothetical protein Tcan_12769 [Toxocara canis]